MRFKSIQRFIRRLTRKSPPDLWQFCSDVRTVMLTRILQALVGDLSAAEARRMVLEKHSAGVLAQHAYTQAFLKGDPALATCEFFDIYRRAVQSQPQRLRKRRWQ